jgi:SAM-dependent methyltransferase
MAGEDDAIVDGLMQLGPLQFRSRIGAHQYRRLWGLVRRHVPHGARVLDWGAGNGHFTWAALELGLDVVACSLEDAAPPFVEGRCEWVRVRDPVTLPFADASFDAVFSVGVLEHVAELGGDEAASLREIERVLRPGGVLVVYHLPNRWSWIEAAARRIPGKHAHARRFGARELRRALGGFELVAHGRYGVLPRNVAGALPDPLRRSRALAAVYDAADALLGVPLRPLAQNWFAIARRSGARSSRGTPRP